jgi:hypothetical protein
MTRIECTRRITKTRTDFFTIECISFGLETDALVCFDHEGDTVLLLDPESDSICESKCLGIYTENHLVVRESDFSLFAIEPTITKSSMTENGYSHPDISDWIISRGCECGHFT